MSRQPYLPPESCRPGALAADWWQERSTPEEQIRDAIDSGRETREELNGARQLAWLGAGMMFVPRAVAPRDRAGPGTGSEPESGPKSVVTSECVTCGQKVNYGATCCGLRKCRTAHRQAEHGTTGDDPA